MNDGCAYAWARKERQCVHAREVIGACFSRSAPTRGVLSSFELGAYARIGQIVCHSGVAGQTSEQTLCFGRVGM